MAEFKVTRTGGASWHIDAKQTHHSESPVQVGDILNARRGTFVVITDPMVTGYDRKFARVREVGGYHDGNEFGMNFTHNWGTA